MGIVRLSGLSTVAHLVVFAQAVITHFLEKISCPHTNLDWYKPHTFESKVLMLMGFLACMV